MCKFTSIVTGNTLLYSDIYIFETAEDITEHFFKISSNSEAFASELLVNNEQMLTRY